jgi:hypothetical protein
MESDINPDLKIETDNRGTIDPKNVQERILRLKLGETGALCAIKF